MPGEKISFQERGGGAKYDIFIYNILYRTFTFSKQVSVVVPYCNYVGTETFAASVFRFASR